MAAPTVTPLPTAPARNVADPETYIGVADTWAAALPTFGAEVQAAGEYANTKALAAASSANSTASDALATAADRVQTGLDRTAASNSAAAAAGSASTAAGWSATSTTSMALTSGSKTLTIQTAKQFTTGTNIKVKRTAAPTTTYAHTTVDTYNSGTGALTFTLASDLIVGSGTYTDWTIELSGARGGTGAGVPTGGTTGQVLKKSSGTDYDAAWADQDVTQILRSARTSNTQLAASDKGKSIEYTTGGFTQTLAACSSLGAGWFVYVVNSSTGDVTFDPNGSETIGGVNAATTAVLKPGQSAILITDGSNLYFAGAPTSFRNMEIFTSGGTFTPKPGVSRYYIKAVGGGGAGSYGGGAAGGYAEGWADITSSQTITIGAGGVGGGNGGATSVGSIVTCNGGAGGASYSGGPASAGGTATFSGGLTVQGSRGGGHNSGASYGGSPGTSPFGGAGAASSGSGAAAYSNSGSGGGGGGGGSGESGGSGLVLIMW